MVGRLVGRSVGRSVCLVNATHRRDGVHYLWSLWKNKLKGIALPPRSPTMEAWYSIQYPPRAAAPLLSPPSFSLCTAAGSLIESTSARPLSSFRFTPSVSARSFLLPSQPFPHFPTLLCDYTFTYEPLNDLTPRVINHPDQLPRCAAVKGFDRYVPIRFLLFFLRRPRTMHIGINGPVMAFIAMLLR